MLQHQCYIPFQCKTEVRRKDPGASTTTSDPKTQTSRSPSLVSTPSTTTAGNSTGTEGQVRLNSGGKYSCSGRVEIFHSGQWGTVCDDSWDLQDASVVCRQLGCGRALSAPHDATFGQGSGPIWLDDVRCFGNETALKNCQHSGFGVHNCGHHKDASAVCECKFVSIVLTVFMSWEFHKINVMEVLIYFHPSVPHQD